MKWAKMAQRPAVVAFADMTFDKSTEVLPLRDGFRHAYLRLWRYRVLVCNPKPDICNVADR